MPDREKVIKGLEVCTSVADDELCPKDCPYYQEVCYGYDQLMRDALALLKEQEAVVHCKDCIWYDKEDPGYTTGICKMNDRMFPKEHFFCAHGFKRSEDDE